MLFFSILLTEAGCQILRPSPPTPTHVAYAIWGGRPYTLQVIDTDTRKKTDDIRLSDYPGPSIAIAPNGKVYVPIQGGPTVTGRTVAVYDPANHQIREIAVGRYPWAVVSSRDGMVYVINQEGGHHGTVSVIDSASDRVVNTIDIGLMPYAMAISDDGRWLYVARDDPDYLYGKPFGLDPRPRPDEPAPAPMTIAMVDTKEGQVKRIAGYFEGSFPTASVWANNKVYVALRSSQVEPDRLKSAGGPPGNTVVVADGSSLQLRTRIEVPPRPERMVLAPNGKLYVQHENDTTYGVTVIDTARDKVIKELSLPVGTLGMATPTLLYMSNCCILDTTTDEVVSNDQFRPMDGAPFTALIGDWAR